MTSTDNFLPLHWHHNYSSSCSKQTDLKEPCVKWAKLCSALNRDAVSLGPKNDKTWGKPMENPQKIDEQLRQGSERPDGENLWTADHEWGSGLAPYISFKKKGHNSASAWSFRARSWCQPQHLRISQDPDASWCTGNVTLRGHHCTTAGICWGLHRMNLCSSRMAKVMNLTRGGHQLWLPVEILLHARYSIKREAQILQGIIWIQPVAHTRRTAPVLDLRLSFFHNHLHLRFHLIISYPTTTIPQNHCM